VFRAPIALTWAASLSLVACAPTTQETHLGRIEHHIRDAEPSAAEAKASLREATESKHLDRARLVRAVLNQNPNLDAARAAWRAQAARYHVQDAPPDPVLTYTIAPGSIFDPEVRFGQIIQLSQTIPWVGKMGSRGDVELHKADMQAATYHAARLELALKACRLFDRYYVIQRSIEINEKHQKIVAQLGKAIEAQYATGKGTLNDPLQVEVTRTQLVREHLMLAADRDVVKAQLNALLHRAPDAELPPPPDELSPSSPDVGSSAAAKQALEARPELERVDAEHKSIEAEIDVAQREYVPDFTLFAQYNTMWAMVAHQFMFGISAPLPVVVGKRDGAESAARAKLTENESRREAVEDQVREEAYEAHVRLREAQRVEKLYRERLIPLSRKQVAAVRRAFGSSEATFYEVLAAQRGLWTVEREWHRALALVQTRAAELERAMGHVPGLATKGGER
jgi:outer membrane protein TolC